MNQVERVIAGRTRDLGGFEVRRLLPAAGRRTIGPFIFFDHMGPARFEAGRGVDVRPHPHIGLATVTYLFDGALMHRDSLGTVQLIRPGDVNWMVAGRGIVHSERTPQEMRAAGAVLHGIQSWVALPRANEEDSPGFAHHPGATIPVIHAPDVTMRVIAGSAFGQRSPVSVCSETLYIDAELGRGARLALPDTVAERALYIAEGEVSVSGERHGVGELVEFATGAEAWFQAVTPARVMLLGGAPTDGPRHIWWNFVSSSLERIERAKLDWRDERYAAVPGETERTPLPDH